MRAAKSGSGMLCQQTAPAWLNASADLIRLGFPLPRTIATLLRMQEIIDAHLVQPLAGIPHASTLVLSLIRI